MIPTLEHRLATRRFSHAALPLLAALQSLACAGGLPEPGTLGGSTTVELPTQMHGRHVFVEATIGDGGPVWLLLDSGAELTLLDTRTVERLGVATAGRSTLRGTGRDTLVGTVTPPLAVNFAGGAGYERQMPAADLSVLDPYFGRRIDGIVGADLFLRYVVEIDYAAGSVRLHAPETFRARAGHVRLPLRIESGLPYSEGALELPDGRLLEGALLIDTGQLSALTLTATFAAKHALATVLRPTIPARGAGIGGETSNVVGRLAAIELGAVRLAGPPAVLTLERGTAVDKGNRMGTVGAAILARFTVTFDYRNGVMYLRPNADMGAPFLENAAGFGVVADRADLRTYRVHYVDVGSPAHSAGLREGDVLEAVNGTPAAQLTLPQIRELLTGKLGDRLSVRVLRSGDPVVLELTLQQRI